MDTAMLFLYADGNIVKKKNGVNYDRGPKKILSVSRDVSYEQLLDHICNRLTINRTTHQVQLHHRVAIEHGSSIYFHVVAVNDNDAVHELLVNMKGSLEVYVQTSEYVNPWSRDEDSGRQVKRQRRGEKRTVLEKYVTFLGGDCWECNFCQHRSNGHPGRIIAHLTCTPNKGIKICPNMSPEIKEKIANELKEAGHDVDGGEDYNREDTSARLLGPGLSYQLDDSGMSMYDLLNGPPAHHPLSTCSHPMCQNCYGPDGCGRAAFESSSPPPPRTPSPRRPASISTVSNLL